MLYLVLAYLIISFLCLWAGWMVYQIAGADADKQRPVVMYMISGLITLTAIGQWLVLITPLSPGIAILLIPLLILATIPFRRRIAPALRTLAKECRTLPLLFWLTLGVMTAMILTLNAGPTIMDDTESYHIQMIKWAQQYGSVKGIANLHLRFGFNSSWFTSAALFSPPVSYTVLNGLISCWLTIYLLQKTTSVSPLKAIAAAVTLMIALAAWPLIRGNAPTANYDFITTCCVLILFVESLKTAPNRGAMPAEWIVWPAFLCTIRILNAPLLVGSLIVWLSHKRRPNTRSAVLHTGTRQTATLQTETLPVSALQAAAAAFLIIPFLIRNIILSGYLFFPIYQLDLFSVDWKVAKPLVMEISDFIKYYNRANASPELLKGIGFPGWIRVWHSQLFIYDRILIDILLAGSLLRLFFRRRRNGPSSPNRTNDILLFFIILQLILWFFTAPDPRFAYGILLAIAYWLVASLPIDLPAQTTRRIIQCITILITASGGIYTIQKNITNAEYANWIMPHTLPVPKARQVSVDGITLRIPEKVLDNWNPRCYDLELPCLYELNPLLHARGSSMRDGFRVDPAPPGTRQNGEYKLQ